MSELGEPKEPPMHNPLEIVLSDAYWANPRVVESFETFMSSTTKSVKSGELAIKAAGYMNGDETIRLPLGENFSLSYSEESADKWYAVPGTLLAVDIEHRVDFIDGYPPINNYPLVRINTTNPDKFSSTYDLSAIDLLRQGTDISNFKRAPHMLETGISGLMNDGELVRAYERRVGIGVIQEDKRNGVKRKGCILFQVAFSEESDIAFGESIVYSVFNGFALPFRIGETIDFETSRDGQARRILQRCRSVEVIEVGQKVPTRERQRSRMSSLIPSLGRLGSSHT